MDWHPTAKERGGYSRSAINWCHLLSRPDQISSKDWKFSLFCKNNHTVGGLVCHRISQRTKFQIASLLPWSRMGRSRDLHPTAMEGVGYNRSAMNAYWSSPSRLDRTSSRGWKLSQCSNNDRTMVELVRRRSNPRTEGRLSGKWQSTIIKLPILQHKLNLKLMEPEGLVIWEHSLIVPTVFWASTRHWADLGFRMLLHWPQMTIYWPTKTISGGVLSAK